MHDKGDPHSPLSRLSILQSQDKVHAKEMGASEVPARCFAHALARSHKRWTQTNAANKMHAQHTHGPTKTVCILHPLEP